MHISISLAQLEFLVGEPDQNFHKVNKFVQNAAENGTELVLLPELWASGYDLKNCQKYASSIQEGMFARMQAVAREHQIAVGGSLIEEDQGIYYNTFVLYDSEGTLIGSYRKIHLFQLLDEKKYFGGGTQLALLETSWGLIGLATCYDLRFPELFRAYAARGAVLVLLAAEWPERRISHWIALVRARAIENQFFMAAVNKVGSSQGETLGGCSLVVNPMGEALIQGGLTEALLTADLDLDEVQKIRRWMPVLQDRKPDLYRQFLDQEKLSGPDK